MSTATRSTLVTVLRGVTYGSYLRIRRMTDDYRMTYYDGTLEIMAPDLMHEHPRRLIEFIISEVTIALGIPCQGAGSTTFSRGQPGRTKGAGKEPDCGFYFGENMQKVVQRLKAKESIDLKVDPPPDLWIEVDNRSSSKGRLPLYARLGVPEVWRYRSRSERLWFGRREDDQYIAVDRSIALPMLTPELVLFALAQFQHADHETAWKLWLRQWAGTLAGP